MSMSRITRFSVAACTASVIALAASTSFAASHKVAEQIDALSKKVEAMGDSYAQKGVKGASLTISGQVNRAVMFLDDAQGSQVLNVDNDASSSRVRFVASSPMANGMKAGARIEVQIESESSNNTNNNNQGAEGGFGARHIDAWLSGGFGKISFGQGSTATDGIMHANSFAAGLADITAEPGMGADAIILGNTQLNQLAFGDGGREDRVRYDTPSFGGFKASVSYANEGHVQLAARYGAKFDGVKVDARIGYESVGSGNNDAYQIAGSAGVTVAGVSANVAMATRESDTAGDDAFFWMVLAGWTGKVNSLGKTGFGVQYGENNGNGAINQVRTIGVGVTQDLAPGTTAYASYKNYKSELAGSEAANVAMVGMRVKF